jgi:hypothetical protein
LLDGHGRWEVFELLGPEPASFEPPHVEDLWVRAIRSRRSSAPADLRREILAKTTSSAGAGIFGVPLALTRSAAYLLPGTGQRSLATFVVSVKDLRFSATWREGTAEPDIRVALPLPGVGVRSLPVKDHHLLLKAESASPDLAGRVIALESDVQRMGDQVAVRLGLSRPFRTHSEGVPAMCWLMADGFFSLSDPQP